MSIDIKRCQLDEDAFGHFWVVMQGKGNVSPDRTVECIAKLQKEIDALPSVYMSRFTFVFDFRELKDFVGLASLYSFAKFMKDNHDFFKLYLLKSHVLLNKPTWKKMLNMLFVVAKPASPVDFEIDQDVLAKLSCSFIKPS